MRIPVIEGIIDRRILVNYRVDPAVLARTLPAPFRPKLFRGQGLAGICLIRLRGVRPRGVPAWLGIGSENAAHRTAVEWDDEGGTREGVFVRRRDTDSRLNSLVGGRLFPGIHHHARFDVCETTEQLEVSLTSDDGATRMHVKADRTDRLPDSSIFQSLHEASAFFEAGSLGYSVTSDPARFQGLELRCRRWEVEPLLVKAVESSFFDDRAAFPRGSIEFDCALLMRNIPHQWRSRPDLVAAPAMMAHC